jgi:hypothetical protein
MNPYRNLSTPEGTIESAPPVVDLLGYPKRTGGKVDYVLLWGLRDGQRNEPRVRRVLDQLAAGYDLVYSEPEGRVWLYCVRRSHGIE